MSQASRLLIWAVFAALGAGCMAPAPLQNPPTSSPKPEAVVVAQPQAGQSIGTDAQAANRMAADVAELASVKLAGRGTGEAGARLAAEFIARRFADLKLEPLGDAVANGGNGTMRTYMQTFQARVGAHVQPPTVVVSRGVARSVDAEMVSTADGSESGTTKGAAVFVGHGISAPALQWDDYAGGDVEGKIVVVLDGAPKAKSADRGAEALRDFGSVRYKLRTAREHKAAGVVIVVHSDELPTAAHDSSSMGIGGVVLAASAAQKLLADVRFGDASVWEPSQASKPKPLGNTTITMTTQVVPRMADAWNVVGMLRARADSPHANEFVVVGAHYDHLGHGGTWTSRAPGTKAIHYGADDNASGTALVLEVARHFSKAAQQPDRNLVFATFSAEEIGVIGSRYFVDHPPEPLRSMKDVAAMINADMVGRLRENKLSVDGVGTSKGWEELVKKATEGLGLSITYGSEGFGGSDHSSFAAARVPVTFLFTGVHDDYHKPSDTADKINYEGAGRIATLAERLMLLVSQQDERLVFVDPPPDPNHATRMVARASLGTIPDYVFQGKGVRLTGVRPDAAASRAGLQAGDIIVKVGTHEITNMHDYVFALKELEPGREVSVEIVRNGTRQTVKVIPAPGR